jgi:hypothetical protein
MMGVGARLYGVRCIASVNGDATEVSMSDPEILRTIVARFSPDQKVSIGKWLGKPCIQTHNKVFVALWGRDLAFKLGEEAQAQALKISGAHTWDPDGRHPKPEWVQIPADQAAQWEQYAKLAYDYVSGRAKSNE